MALSEKCVHVCGEEGAHLPPSLCLMAGCGGDLHLLLQACLPAALSTTTMLMDSNPLKLLAPTTLSSLVTKIEN